MRKLPVLSVLVIILVFTFGALAVQNGHDLFQKALAKERAEGNLEEAITLYRKVIEGTEDKALAAKAQLRIGICYEKLGRQEAQKAFQKVIDNYPGQLEAVEVARDKLSNLLKSKSVAEKDALAYKTSKVWQGEGMDDSGEISPNNKYFSCVDWSTGDLALRDMVTGKIKRLTNKGPWTESKECAYSSIWSPDSKYIAYTWYNADPSFCDLRVTDINSGKTRILYHGDFYNDWINPLDWAPDGKFILSQFIRKEGTWEMGLVSVEDSSIQYLKTIHGLDPQGYSAKFSARGRFIVYDHPQAENSRKSDISCLSIDDKQKFPLINHPADDRLMDWAMDGRNVVIISDRTGTWDCWTVQVSEGKMQGEPRLISRQIGKINSLSLAQDGSFYSFGLNSSMKEASTQ
jgi:hypothetical protein